MTSDEIAGYVARLLEARRERFVQSLSQPMADDLKRYFLSHHKGEIPHDTVRGFSTNIPYWALLPMWFDQKRAGRAERNNLHRTFVDDVIWAQYCLFQQVRIHDDLLDGHESNLALIFAANQFLFEAEHTLMIHFPHQSPFWKIYVRCIETTNRSVIEVKSFQASKTIRPAKILLLHANVCSIFKVGSAALCIKTKKAGLYRRLEVFLDEMAKISQALDDFQDIEEDLQRGEINYAAAFILQTESKTLPSMTDTLPYIIKQLLVSDVMKRYFHVLRKHLARARTVTLPLHLQPVVEYLDIVKSQLASAEDSLHQRRVQFVFGKLAAS